MCTTRFEDEPAKKDSTGEKTKVGIGPAKGSNKKCSIYNQAGRVIMGENKKGEVPDS